MFFRMLLFVIGIGLLITGCASQPDSSGGSSSSYGLYGVPITKLTSSDFTNANAYNVWSYLCNSGVIEAYYHPVTGVVTALVTAVGSQYYDPRITSPVFTGLTEGNKYILTFYAKASVSKKINLVISRMQTPDNGYQTVETNEELSLPASTNFIKYSFIFNKADGVDNSVSFELGLDTNLGTFQFSNVAMSVPSNPILYGNPLTNLI
jgi:hypothetical protein